MKNLPLSTELQQLATDYVLDNLDMTQIMTVEKLMEENSDFREEILKLQTIEEMMIMNIPQIEPPSNLLDKIMKASFGD